MTTTKKSKIDILHPLRSLEKWVTDMAMYRLSCICLLFLLYPTSKNINKKCNIQPILF
jgi:hypothetical protein